MGFRKILFPNRCPGCDKIQAQEEFCQECKKKLVPAVGAVCCRCGKVLQDRTSEYCKDCRNIRHIFEEARSVYLYEGPMKMGMYRFKYSNRRCYGRVYGRDAVRFHSLWLRQIQPEAVIPVPMFYKKQRVRGYNQAEVFAKCLGDVLQIPVLTDFVQRIRPTLPMKTMSPEERRRNLIHAFQCQKTSVNLNRVILVDDIYTTGTTVDAITEVLRRAGVQEVYVMCICVGRGS